MPETNFHNLWSSKSLVYRALENNAQDKTFLYESMMEDPTNWAQSTNRLLGPLTQDEIGKILDTLTKALLGVMICLPPPKDTDGESVPIGYLCIDGPAVSSHHRSCTFGISIKKQYQGKGYGKEAINWSLNWAFRVAGMHAFRLSCFSFNEGAVRLYERIGFVREGVNREAYFYDGEWYDRVMFSLLEKEWRNLQVTGSS